MLKAFGGVNLVGLGERHWAKEDSRFRLALVRNPVFPHTVNDIVVEFANPLYQSVLDHFVAGAPVAAGEVQNAWRNTTQPGAFDSLIYEQFLNAVREVNARLPPQRRVRVLAADYPIDWCAISTPADLDGPVRGRDRSAASIIERQVLDRNRKALVIFGSAHLYRKRAGTIIDLLKQDSRAKWFIVVPVGGPGLPDIIGTNTATAEAPAFLKLAGGKPLFEDGKPVFVPVFEAGVNVGDLADACLYFGTTLPEFVQPPAGLYEHTAYAVEVQRRRRLLNLAISLQ